MDYYVKIKDVYKKASYVVRPIDQSWDNRESIEVKIEDVSYEDVLETFKNGSWSFWHQEEKWVEDEPVTSEDSDPKDTPSGHTETVWEEKDMSNYCVCGWVRNNMDSSASVKMGELSEMEKLIESLIGGAI